MSFPCSVGVVRPTGPHEIIDLLSPFAAKQQEWLASAQTLKVTLQSGSWAMGDGEDCGGNLNQQPSNDDIGHRDLNDVSSF